MRNSSPWLSRVVGWPRLLCNLNGLADVRGQQSLMRTPGCRASRYHDTVQNNSTKNNNKNRLWVTRFSWHRRANPVHYERRRPEDSTLSRKGSNYRLVQEHAESFFAQVEAETGGNKGGNKGK